MEEYKVKMHEDISDKEYSVLVSNYGDIFVFKPLKTKNEWHLNILKTYTDQGYEKIKIRGNYYMVSRLVAETWLELPKDYDIKKYEVHHIDGNKLNNKASNLYVIAKESHKTLHSIKYLKKIEKYRKTKVNENVVDILDKKEVEWVLSDIKKMNKNEEDYNVAFHSSNTKKIYISIDNVRYEIAV